ncbi:P-loop containing nucleoside triphosphate hydrolase protein [Dothidotthia symphoricarpi CBS 119687]|uniref:Pre-mRNA-splicing factor n=1 Tax=Dothidotthia symphoricarpi CBS 119687 TaxID=1392245 RepID=A0A6A6ARE5_9PLEO|nr:P-loop containing nucleoside triphosphate hydrolase protein [Dothidotthia symphoricarpi CBS 119687]KAF2133417.1 P-loop containing nucleoside triphosphate hydrolase protein [Dothidotthia symphoricarpi CBS 119687]
MEESNVHARPTVADLHGDNHFAQAARKHWLAAKKTAKVRPDVVKKELWDELEKVDFAYSSLLILENLQLLERYLWPGFTEDASNHHHLLLALMVNVKRRENLPSWEHFATKPADFSSFFRRILSMTVDPSQPSNIRTQLVAFVIGAFQSLDSGLVRKECAPLVGISIWQHLHSEAVREQLFGEHHILRKAWRAASKRFDAADDALQARLRFERSWLYTLLLDFVDRLYNSSTKQDIRNNLAYCERFIELLTDLQSQLPTRRYVSTLLQDLNMLPAIRLSPMYTDEDNGLFRDLFDLLSHFTYFPIEDQTGKQLSKLEYDQQHYDVLAKLQRTGYAAFQEKLQLMALANYGSIGNREELDSHLRVLSDDELVELCSLMGLRTEYPASTFLVRDRAFYMETLVSLVEQRPTFKDVVRDMPVFPTEKVLYETTFLRNESYDGSRPLAIPKLNLQYLTMGDFLWRSFILYRAEAFYGIRKDMEDVIKRVKPKGKGVSTKFDGFSRMSIPIMKPGVVDVAPSKVGEEHPAYVRAEIILDVSRLQLPVRKEWDSLRTDDVVFLLAVEGKEDVPMRNGGHTEPSTGEQVGLHKMRCAQVVQVLDENGRPLREQNQTDGFAPRARSRRLVVNIDAKQYQADMDHVAEGRPNIYEHINLIVRRKGRENNFLPILDSIRRLTLSDIPAPSWLQEVFLGYGDPASATYKRLPNRLKSIDFRDTFLDWQHLIESLPGESIEPEEDAQTSFGPPYVVQYPAAVEQEVAPARPSKKRRRDHPVEVAQPVHQSLHVATYKPPNMGPYPADAPKTNAVRFTPAQIEAITSGTQPGLTVVLGPPGTGKTDVATQIISNIYHNFPDQRTLLVAHSNQALNQLFQKIVALDIDERHLLRLGHGEEDLETEASYSKHGRVESFLERGTYYLAEVDRLAKNLGAPGAHGSSCETADYFNLVYVKPAWTQYWDSVSSEDSTVEQIVADFPFRDYFLNAPQPLFPPASNRQQILDIAQGCYRHVEKLFTELEDIRPFEILRNPRDKANYLLVKEARIIAMTSTHAAMRRQEIAALGFHYDNLIMEEAAQITEIENFIPLALQEPRNGTLPLQRIVLVGDHLQNAPIVQNLAFRQYANLEQSLFQRLVRLGVPTIMLDQQGRARPSIADLYKWRYTNLSHLPAVSSAPEFTAANPGFRYEYQFINVPDYKEKGELEPTPHCIQNLGEAEYAVALFQYMRLLGYPAGKISLLTTYAGQRDLIKDVLAHRCKANPLFGLPRVVATVDKYQGEQNDYIILSLVRTRSIGYLRDIRRLTVALSRARLGLYILGRRAVFEAVFELKPAFDMLFRRPDSLALVTGEMYGDGGRRVGEAEVQGEAVMQGVEHLGRYVFEMTRAKVEDLRGAGAGAGGGAVGLPTREVRMVDVGDEEVKDGRDGEGEADV